MGQTYVYSSPVDGLPMTTVRLAECAAPVGRLGHCQEGLGGLARGVSIRAKQPNTNERPKMVCMSLPSKTAVE